MPQRRWFVMSLLLMFFMTVSPTAASGPPAVGETLPAFALARPQAPGDLAYLGLPPLKDGEPSSFTLSQLGGKVLVIEIFSMYCPFCQKEAPIVNRIFDRLQADAALKDRIRFIGIGVGNSTFEVDYFRKTYAVPFPLIPDGDFTIHKQLGEVRTPFFIGLHLDGEQPGKIFFTQLGAFQDPEDFIKAFPHLAGLE